MVNFTAAYDMNYSWHFHKLREVMGSPRKSFGIGKRMELLQIQRFHCVGCLDKLYDEPRELHVHHVVPLCLGGTNGNNNLVIICKRCHDHQHGSCSNMTYFDNVIKWVELKYKKFDDNILDFIPYRVQAGRLFHHSHFRDVMPFAESDRRVYYVNGERKS